MIVWCQFADPDGDKDKNSKLASYQALETEVALSCK